MRSYCLFETPLGPCAIAWSAAGLTRVLLPGRDAEATEHRARRDAEPWAKNRALPDVAAKSVAALTAYFAGDRPDLGDLLLDWSGIPDFHRRIYRALALVPYGTTVTYGALAHRIGEPGAARAVGAALGRNPWPVLIPCHRVLASGHKLGGFSAPGGVATKRALLGLEGALAESTAPLLPGLLAD